MNELTIQILFLFIKILLNNNKLYIVIVKHLSTMR